MKLLIVFAALIAIAIAAPPTPAAEILRFNSEVLPESFSYDVETSDGTKHDAAGVLKNVGTENEAISVQGSFSYIGDDGVTYAVTYLADENGFQPQGAHLPVA